MEGLFFQPPSPARNAALSSDFLRAEFLLAEVVQDFASATHDTALVNSFIAEYSSIVTEIFGPGGETVFIYASLSDASLQSRCINQYATKSASFRATNPSGFFIFTAEPPCCNTCDIFGQAVEVRYWPTPAPSPPVSVLVDDATNKT
jgi:hypothetical protein